MVNNAGVGGTEHHGMVHEMTEQTWDNVMNVNSRSVFLGCKYACAQFLNQTPHSSGHKGWIINTASIMGLVGQAVYGGMSTKWYCLSFARTDYYSRLLCVKRSRSASNKADRRGVCEA